MPTPDCCCLLEYFLSCASHIRRRLNSIELGLHQLLTLYSVLCTMLFRCIRMDLSEISSCRPSRFPSNYCSDIKKICRMFRTYQCRLLCKTYCRGGSVWREVPFFYSKLNLKRATQNFLAFLSLFSPRPGAISSSCHSGIIIFSVMAVNSAFHSPLMAIRISCQFRA